MKKINKIAVFVGLILSLPHFAFAANREASESFDPMKVRKYKEVAVNKEGPLSIQAIIVPTTDINIIQGSEYNEYDSRKLVIMVEDQIFSAGDSVNGYKVLKIEKNKVHLFDPDKKIQTIIVE